MDRCGELINFVKIYKNSFYKLIIKLKMKKLFQKVLALAMIAMIVPSCGNPAKMAEKADQLSATCTPEVLEVVAGKINTQISVVFPAEFFHPKAIVEVQPVIVYNGGEAMGELVMLQGEDVTENYITVPEAGSTVTRNLTLTMLRVWKAATWNSV